MKSLNLFLVLLISITIIYLALINKQNFKYDFNYQESQNEHFAIDPKTTIANRLGFDPSRLHNYKEVGDVTKANEFQVQFDIYPRTINQISEPSIADLVKNFSKLKLNENPITIETTYNKKILLAKISFEELENKKIAELRDLETKFENSEFIPAAKYLESLHRGVPNDPWIEPRYTFKDNKLVLETLPIPTMTPTPTPTSTTTSTPTVRPARSN